VTEPGVKYYTVKEVADHLRVSKMTIYRLIDAEFMPAVRVGRVFRIPAQGLVAYVRDHRETADPSIH